MMYTIVELPIQIATCAWGLHMARQYARDRTALKAQLSGFRCEDTQCFCCAVDHLLPGTDIAISCDRQAIYLAINCWFKGGLSELEKNVHEMEPVVSAGLGVSVLSYQDLLHLLLPGLWLHLSQKGAETCGDWADILYFVVIGLTVSSLDLILFAAIMRVATMTQNKLVLRKCSCDLAYTVFLTIVISLFYFGWFQIYLYVVWGDYLLFAFYIGFNFIVSWLLMTGASQVASCYRRWIRGERPPVPVPLP